MKISDIDIRFPENQRPITVITFNKPIIEAQPVFVGAYEKQFQCTILRGQDGDYIVAAVDKPPKKHKEFPKLRMKMKDGTTRLHHPLLPTSSVAVNAALRMCDPIMECLINDPEQGAIKGHVDVIAVARLLYSYFSSDNHERDITAPAMACVEWPSGIRVYEPVLCVFSIGNDGWKAKPNRPTDKIVFLCAPDDKLTPLLQAIDSLKTAANDDPRRTGQP